MKVKMWRKDEKKRSSEIFGDELIERKLFLTCGHPRTSLAPGIQDPLHATGPIFHPFFPFFHLYHIFLPFSHYFVLSSLSHPSFLVILLSIFSRTFLQASLLVFLFSLCPFLILSCKPCVLVPF